MKISCLKKRGLNNFIKCFYVLKVFTFFNDILNYRLSFKFNVIIESIILHMLYYKALLY